MTEKPYNTDDTAEAILTRHEDDLANDERMDFALKGGDFLELQSTLFEQMTAAMEGEGVSEDEVRERTMMAFKSISEAFAYAVLALKGTQERVELAVNLDRLFSLQLRQFSEEYGSHQIVPIQGSRSMKAHYEEVFNCYDADEGDFGDAEAGHASELTELDAVGDPAVFTGLAAEFHDEYHGYVTELIDNGQPNKNDVASQLKSDIKEHALDVAKVALGAAIAGVAFRFLRR